MKKFWWVPLSVGFVCFYAWFTIGSATPNPSIFILPIVLIVMLGNIGTFWMWYVAIRWEVRPLPFLLLGFLPFSFLWYYFERYRGGRHKTRSN